MLEQQFGKQVGGVMRGVGVNCSSAVAGPDRSFPERAVAYSIA